MWKSGIVLYCCFVLSILADYAVVRQSPLTTLSLNTSQFVIEINQTVNQPQFPSFICFYNVSSNMSFYRIDAHVNTTNVTYMNRTLTFYTPSNLTFSINNEFYITFDAGVLFSNGMLNSTAQYDPNFWRLKVIDTSVTTTATTTGQYTSMGINSTSVTTFSTAYTDTSTFTMSTYTSMNMTTVNPSNITTITTTTTTSSQLVKGEPPPSRSAQLGMGFGITIIALIIIGEVLYFKFCYDGNGRSGSYAT